MLISQRVFFDNNGTFEDLSTRVNEFRSENATIPVETTDYIYIASERPFNSRYFNLSTVNSNAATMTLEVWNGDSWFEPVDLIDGTDGFTKSGYVRFNLDPDGVNHTWTREPRSKDVAGVGTQADVYEMYWSRISFSADLSITTAMAHIGVLFSQDVDLFSYYPDLNNTNLMTAWESGKTNWQEQTFSAASEIMRELKRKSILKDFSGFGIMEPDLFNEASIHKTAQIIYSGLGKSFTDEGLAAFRSYNEAIDRAFFVIDQNCSGTVEQAEKMIRTGFITR